MVTNKALYELECWARAANEGQGDVAKRHLTQFAHIGAGFIASKEFQQRCEELVGGSVDPQDLDRICKILDAIANIEVNQVEKYGTATDSSAPR